MAGRVEGKTILVSGGASGIGEATAILLAKEGARVIIADLAEELGHDVAARIVAQGGNAAFIKLDVSNQADWVAAVALAEDGSGPPMEALVNCAGVGWANDVEKCSLEDWRRLLAINLDGAFLGTQTAIGAMKALRRGSIVLISSTESIVGNPGLAAYDASKGGVRAFTRSAALHCGTSGYNIRVNTICPGYIWTPMLQSFAASTGDTEAARQAMEGMHPIGRLGVPDDIAYGALFLASDESTFMTGTDLIIDGGFTAQ